MAGLMIKDLPEALHAKLKVRAAANRRSLAREVLVLLEEAVNDRAGPPTLAEIDALRYRGPRPLTQDILDQAREEGRH